MLRAIREDPRLTGRQRQALTQVYEAFVMTGPQPSRSRRPAAEDDANPVDADADTDTDGA